MTETPTPEFDDFLERELGRRLGRTTGPSPLASQARFRRAGRGAPVWSKAAAAAVAAAFLAAGGSALAAVATGSTSPSAWARSVAAAVAGCKDHVEAGHDGIAGCVNAVAGGNDHDRRGQHGAPSPSPSSSPAPGRQNVIPTASPSAPGRGQGRHEGQESPHPGPSSQPTPPRGRPSPGGGRHDPTKSG